MWGSGRRSDFGLADDVGLLVGSLQVVSGELPGTRLDQLFEDAVKLHVLGDTA